MADAWRHQASGHAIARVLNVSIETLAALPVLDEWLATVPDDFRQNVRDVEAHLRDQHARVVAHIDDLWEARPGAGNTSDAAPIDRRAFATWAATTSHARLLFSRLDGHPWQLQAWAHCRPESTSVPSGRAAGSEALEHHASNATGWDYEGWRQRHQADKTPHRQPGRVRGQVGDELFEQLPDAELEAWEGS